MRRKTLILLVVMVVAIFVVWKLGGSSLRTFASGILGTASAATPTPGYQTPANGGKALTASTSGGGYTPAVSYGQYGITNSDAVDRLFGGNVAYHPDAYQLAFDGRSRLMRLTLPELHSAMDFVAENHTYLNRIDSITKAARLMLENR